MIDKLELYKGLYVNKNTLLRIFLMLLIVMVSIISCLYTYRELNKGRIEQDYKAYEQTKNTITYYLALTPEEESIDHVIIMKGQGFVGFNDQNEEIFNTLQDDIIYAKGIDTIQEIGVEEKLYTMTSEYKYDEDDFYYYVYTSQDELQRIKYIGLLQIMVIIGIVAVGIRGILVQQYYGILSSIKFKKYIDNIQQVEDFDKYSEGRSPQISDIIKSFNEMMIRITYKHQALKRNEEKYRIAMEATSDLSFEIDLESDRFITNLEKCVKRLGYQIPTKYQDAIACLMPNIHEKDREEVRECLSKEAYKKKSSDILEFQIKGVDNEYVWYQGTFVAIKDNCGKVVRVVSYMRNIDKRKKLELEAIKQSKRDGLTGVYNKIAIEEKVTEYLERKNNKGVNALLFLDLDDFKGINDHFGHQIGDSVLEDVVKIIQHNIREKDYIGRVGGDEFVIFIKERESLLEIKEQLDMIVKKLNVEYICDDGCYTISTSMGCAIQTDKIICYQQLLKQADSAMYEAKFKGKNMYHIYGEIQKEVKESV